MISSAPLAKLTDQWERIASLRPQLKPHFSLSRHLFRKQISFILEDSITKNRYRFPKEAYEIVGRLTGRHTISELYNYLTNLDDPKGISKESLVEVITQLNRLEALTDFLPEELLGQPIHPNNNQKNSLLSQLKKSPLFLRLPLFNPSTVIERYQHLTKPFFGKLFFSLLLILFATGACVLLINLPELTNDSLDRIFTRHNLFILWLLYPVVKTIHEFAHAFAVKHYGGQVTEMGLMLLLFMPVPYVNASDSASFTNKWQRITVAGAGIVMELVLATLALLLWTSVEPGLIRILAFNTMLICGVSTLIFNGNPLVRYDGYYILSDLIEIPNLATKSSSYIWYYLLKFLTGITAGKPTAESRAEKRWCILYGLASFVYRLTIYGSIFYFFAVKLGAVGAVIACVAIGQLLFLPLMGRLRPIMRSQPFHAKKRIIYTRLAVFSSASLILIGCIPLPYSTPAEGVIWQPETNLVKMQTSGIVTKVLATDEKKLQKGDILIQCQDAELQHAILLLESQLSEFRLKETAAFAQNPFEAKIIEEKLADLTERLEHKKKQAKDLTILSPQTGNFIAQHPGELVGRYFNQGASLGFIQNSTVTIRALISQKDIAPISKKVSDITISVASEPGKTFTGTILSHSPHATFTLPSATLSTDGGGTIITNPEDSANLTTLEEMFQLDILLSTPIVAPFPESRAYLRFHHDSTPLFSRWIRRLRQLFLTQFSG